MTSQELIAKWMGTQGIRGGANRTVFSMDIVALTREPIAKRLQRVAEINEIAERCSQFTRSQEVKFPQAESHGRYSLGVQPNWLTMISITFIRHLLGRLRPA